MKKIATIVFYALSLSIFGQFSGGTGTSVDPYQIATKTDLKTLSENPIHWDKHFIQTADIVFNSIDYAPGGDFYNGDSLFNPIGNGIVTFSGSYNGKGYLIDSLKINRPLQDYVGFFGLLNYLSSIHQMSLINVEITGHNYVGGLAGQCYDGIISNSHAEGNVIGNDFVGGLFGMLNYADITYSYSTGSVTGNDGVGGLVGHQSNSEVLYCYSSSNVLGNTNVGGLVGAHNGMFSTISNSYATGDVTGMGFVGGLAGGNEGIIVFSYSTGLVNGTSNFGGLVGLNPTGNVIQSFWDINTSGQPTSDGGSGKTTLEMQTQSTFTNNNWDFVGENMNGTYDYWIMPGCSGVGYPLLSWQLFSGGEGTITNPFLIGTKTNLKNLSETICLWDRHFKQIKNIQFSSTDFISGGDFYNVGSGFSPIGNDVTNFTGSYDGQNYFIDSLYINRASSDYIGLFGFTNAANLSYTHLTNVDFNGDYSIGGLVGRCDATIINTCSSSGTINCLGQAGGLAGVVLYSSEITGSHSSVNMFGDAELGGLVGRNENSSIIQTSYATGSVTGNAFRFGGLVALNNTGGIITNSYATGNVNGSADVGGLVGANFASSIISNSYSVGAVSGSSDTGGLLGFLSSGTITNSYWDTQTSGQSTSAGGTGKTTIQMQTENTFTSSPSDWDFIIETTNGTNDYWKMGNCATNHGYPIFSGQPLNTVVIPSTPTITAGGPTTFCAGDSVSITSSIGDNYLWSNGETTESIHILNSDSITVQIISASGCASDSSNQIIVIVNPTPSTPTASAIGNTTFCDGGSVTINSTTGDNYLWNTGATTSTIVVSDSDTVYVQTESNEGCISDTSNMIIIAEIDCSGMEELENVVTIYPNPSSDFITINSVDAIKNIILYNSFGQIVGIYNNQNIINISNQNAGIYLLELNMTDKTSFHRIIIK